MSEKLNKFRIYKYLKIFYEYTDNSIFEFFVEQIFILVINCIKHHYISKESQLNFFKEDSKKSAKILTYNRNTKNIYLEEIEKFIY